MKENGNSKTNCNWSEWKKLGSFLSISNHKPKERQERKEVRPYFSTEAMGCSRFMHVEYRCSWTSSRGFTVPVKKPVLGFLRRSHLHQRPRRSISRPSWWYQWTVEGIKGVRSYNEWIRIRLVNFFHCGLLWCIISDSKVCGYLSL